jgi:hypothetical protein
LSAAFTTRGVSGHLGVGARRASAFSTLRRLPLPVSTMATRGRVMTSRVSVPLVEGTPPSRGSIATAARSERANALNSASTMWWAFSP